MEEHFSPSGLGRHFVKWAYRGKMERFEMAEDQLKAAAEKAWEIIPKQDTKEIRNPSVWPICNIVLCIVCIVSI